MAEGMRIELGVNYHPNLYKGSCHDNASTNPSTITPFNHSTIKNDKN
jgi:hypothetical protein